MINQEYNWYASRTKSRAEFKAVEFLQKHGVDSFCPSKWSDRIKRVIVPLFSQYIFARISYKELPFLSECPGIAGPFIGQVAEIISAGDRNQAFVRIGKTGLAIRIPLSQVQLIKPPSDV